MAVSTGCRRFRLLGTGLVFMLVAAWVFLSSYAALRQGTWADEAGYIIKSWWYVSGAVKPYSAEDTTWYQPLFFYVTGGWQWLFGHDVQSSRFLWIFVTAINIGLLIGLLRRLGCGTWPIAVAVIVFALSEDSIFYFSSATPYACAVALQLAAFHILLGMEKKASYARALALGAVLTAAYLLRVNLISFIALCFSVAWVRAGRDHWRVYFSAAAVFVVTWSSLALIWGRRFVYVSIWFPIVTDWLIRAGLLPELYVNARSFSRQMLINPPSTLSETLKSAFEQDMLRDWVIGHHFLPIAAALLATIVAALLQIPNRGWCALFAASYWGMLVFHHVGAQSYCPICIQAYANYFNYLGALAGGLCLEGLMSIVVITWVKRSLVIGAAAVSLALAAEQSWSLTGRTGLPSIRNRSNSLPQEVRLASDAVSIILRPGSEVGFVGLDSRIPLALAQAGVRVPPVTLSLTSFYRKLSDSLSPEQRDRTVEEIGDLSMWTDVIAKRWIQEAHDWLVVQRLPDGGVPLWLIWSAEAPLVKSGLAKCFERVATKSFDAFTPPLSFDLYRRTRRGRVCLED